MKININDTVRIKLRKGGVRIYREYYGREPLPDSEGKLKMQLWTVMRVFGPAIGMGFDIPMETEIELFP